MHTRPLTSLSVLNIKYIPPDCKNAVQMETEGDNDETARANHRAKAVCYDDS